MLVADMEREARGAEMCPRVFEKVPSSRKEAQGADQRPVFPQQGRRILGPREDRTQVEVCSGETEQEGEQR